LRQRYLAILMPAIAVEVALVTSAIAAAQLLPLGAGSSRGCAAAQATILAEFSVPAEGAESVA
jgi:hypothetical protein